MANPLGKNGHERRGRPLADALRTELFADDRRQLKDLVRCTLRLALAGEAWAQQLVYERIDGRVPQPIGGSDELGPTKLQIEWKLSPINGLAAQPEPDRLPAPAGVQLIDCKPEPQPIENTGKSD